MFCVEYEREDDGRWLAEIRSIPGALAYGATREDAIRATQVLALRVIADRLELGEAVPKVVIDSFLIAETGVRTTE